MNVLDNAKLSLGLFLVALWSSVLRLMSCQQLTAFSRVSADIGSLQVLGDPLYTGSAIDCARAWKQRREKQPKCDWWTFDRLQSTPCKLYIGPINGTNSSNGDLVYRFTFASEIISSQSLPFYMDIRGILVPGSILYISGSIAANPLRFSVDLRKEHDEDKIRMAVRFDYGGYRNMTIWNSKLGAKLRIKKRSGTSSFLPGTSFTMRFKYEPDFLTAHVNDEYWYEFKYHAQTFNTVDQLVITGDVSLTEVRFQ